ncbi:hypothetical protein LguiA_030915 [Lonicera macranthoides]
MRTLKKAISKSNLLPIKGSQESNWAIDNNENGTVNSDIVVAWGLVGECAIGSNVAIGKDAWVLVAGRLVLEVPEDIATQYKGPASLSEGLLVTIGASGVVLFTPVPC